ncbi:MAG: M61 family metallopeptidase [Lautropia sp.]
MERIHYRIRPIDPHAHLFEVTLRIADAPADAVVIGLPAWIPGSYMIRDFSRHVEALVASQRGSEPRVRKLDKSHWRIEGHRARSSLTVRYRVYAWDLSVRAAHLDATHGFFNGTSVFVFVAGREREPVSVDIERPAGARFARWRVATTLPPAAGKAGAALWGFGRYRTSDYDELVDHPVEMGEFRTEGFDVGGCRHEIVLTGAGGRVDLERVARDLAPVCAAQIALFEPTRKRAPVSRYLFLTMATPDGYGGLEHRASTALICTHDDLPWPGMRDATDGYRGFLGLASHEYFHTWHVKRIKPAVFDPYDLGRESHTSLLWIFEGFTSYYDDLMLRRAGVVDDAAYLKLLGKAIDRVLAGPGRLLQSTAESSFDAWTKYYRQDENSPNSIVSYYVKGSLVALCLDLEIRAKTRSRRSLDDVMRLMWQRWGRDFYSSRAGAAHGLGEDAFAAVLKDATGLDLRDEIAAWAYGVDDLPIARLVAPFGIAFEPVPAGGADGGAGSADPRGAKAVTRRAGARRAATPAAAGASIGARTGARDGAVAIVSADRDGPAARAGLSAGDLVIAIDGMRCTEASLKTALARARPGDRMTMHAFRRHALMRFDLSLAAPRVEHVLRVTGPSALRRHWLEERAPGRGAA